MKTTLTLGPRQLLVGLLAAVLAVAVITSLVTAAVVRSDGTATAPSILGDRVVGSVDSAVTVQSASYQAAVAAAEVDLPKVTVVATGGTIAGRATAPDTFTSYRAGSYLMDDLLDTLRPEIDAIADVDAVQFGNAGSSGYSIEAFRELTLAVEEALESSDAVIVTTGTDTQEEFAYWLDLTVQSKKPVITTGAMRPWAAGATPDVEAVFGSDGPANLYNAIKLAASQQTFCFGTVTMLGDEIFAAREVTKTNSYRMDTFQAPENGVLGWIDGNNITVTRAPARVTHCDAESWFTPFDVSAIEAADLPRTEVVISYQQAGGEAISGLVAGGAEGIVTMGTGAGGISSAMSQARRSAIAEGVWFVNTTRTGTGSSYSSGNGIIAGGDLTGVKARLMLLLSRAFTDDIEQARSWFATHAQPSFDQSGQVGQVAPTPDDAPVTFFSSATTACVGGRAQLVLTARNTDPDPIDVRIESPAGQKRWADVAPGSTVTHTFPQRTATLAAGTATFRGYKYDGGAVTADKTVDYAAIDCG